MMKSKRITSSFAVFNKTGEPKKSSGFTLIELLVVIAIIALLVSILLPSLNEAKNLAKLAVCKSGLHAFGIAFATYATDHDGSYPVGSYWNYPVAGPQSDFWGYHMMPYTGDENSISPFFCPLSATTAGYSSGRLRMDVFPTGGGMCHQTYIYLGNYSYEMEPTGSIAPSRWISGEDYDLFQKGELYPRGLDSGRAKLMQDSVSTYWYSGTSHDKPNTLYTDGSVEGGEKDPYSGLKEHVRPNGVFWW